MTTPTPSTEARIQGSSPSRALLRTLAWSLPCGWAWLCAGIALGLSVGPPSAWGESPEPKLQELYLPLVLITWGLWLLLGLLVFVVARGFWRERPWAAPLAALLLFTGALLVLPWELPIRLLVLAPACLGLAVLWIGPALARRAP